MADPEFQRFAVTQDTLLAQSIIFIFAGFETSSYTLSNFAYQMAAHPEVQKRVLREVDENQKKFGGRVDHESIQELPYITACINETLRLSPTILRLERCCTQDWTHPDTGFQVKKGQLVQVPLWALHLNPDTYENPHEFRPERFVNAGSLSDSVTHIPFGIGPRNCVAMRFALESLKLSILHIFKEFEFRMLPETRHELRPGMLFVSQYYPIMLNVVRRNNETNLQRQA